MKEIRCGGLRFRRLAAVVKSLNFLERHRCDRDAPGPELSFENPLSTIVRFPDYGGLNLVHNAFGLGGDFSVHDHPLVCREHRAHRRGELPHGCHRHVGRRHLDPLGKDRDESQLIEGVLSDTVQDGGHLHTHLLGGRDPVLLARGLRRAFLQPELLLKQNQIEGLQVCELLFQPLQDGRHILAGLLLRQIQRLNTLLQGLLLFLYALDLALPSRLLVMELLLVLVKPFLVFALLLLLLAPADEVLNPLAAAGLHLDCVHLGPSLREGVLTGLVLRALRTLKR